MIDNETLFFFIAIIFVVSGFSIYLVFYFSHPRTSMITFAFTCLGWILSFATIFLIPLNIANNDKELFAPTWKIIYWSSFALSWLFLPIICSYDNSADFSFFWKLVYSLKINLYYYIFYAVVAGIYVLYLFISGNSSNIYGFLIAFSNTYCLFNNFIFMGNGLIEVPRYFWNQISLTRRYKYTICNLLNYHRILEDHKFALETAIYDALKLFKETPPEFKEYCTEIVSMIPMSYRSMAIYSDSSVFRKDPQITYDLVTQVNYNLRIALTEYTANLEKYEKYLKTSIDIHNILSKSKINFSEEFLDLRSIDEEVNDSTIFLNSFIYPIINIVLFIFFVLIGIFIVISEASLSVSQLGFDPSIFKLLWKALNLKSELMIILITMTPLIMMVICSCYSVFNFKLANFYGLYPNRKTDPSSLSYSAILIARLACPLCYNYLFLWGINNTQFQKFMGIMDDIPVFGIQFEIYSPWFLLLLLILNLFQIYDTIMTKFHLESFTFTGFIDLNTFQTGQLHLRKEIQRMERDRKSFIINS